MKKISACIVFILAMAALTVVWGCGGGSADDEPAAAEMAEVAETATEEASTPLPKRVSDPSSRSSVEGRFRVWWPRECELLNTRTIESHTRPGEYSMVTVTGSYKDQPERGFSATVWFEHEGGAPTPELVTGRITNNARVHDLEIIRQTPMAWEGMEGVITFCREKGEGGRHTRIYGYIVGDRSVLLMGWAPGVEIFAEPDFRRFFDTFELE